MMVSITELENGGGGTDLRRNSKSSFWDMLSSGFLGAIQKGKSSWVIKCAGRELKKSFMLKTQTKSRERVGSG